MRVREIGGGESRERRELTCAWRRRQQELQRNNRLETTPARTINDGEPPEISLILLSSSRRRRRGCRDGGEVAEKIFFNPRPSEFGGFYKKLTCTVT